MSVSKNTGKLTKYGYGVLFLAFLLGLAACGKGKDAQPANTVIGSKYAKYAASVRKAEDLKDWLATLEKAEEVKLLEEFERTGKNNKSVTIAKVKLADDQIGFIETQHLANDPIVFTEDTRAFSRPIATSKVVVTIPKGTIGFIVEEKDGWAQVYIGKMDGKWITQHWVESSRYTIDAPLVLDAREYEAAVQLIAAKKYEEARTKLENLANSQSFFAQMASAKLEEMQVLEMEKAEEDIKNENNMRSEQEPDGEPAE